MTTRMFVPMTAFRNRYRSKVFLERRQGFLPVPGRDMETHI